MGTGTSDRWLAYRHPERQPFDAIVGRLILEFLPNPRAVIKSLVSSLRPGGVLAIQDAYWAPILQLSADLPLRSKCATLFYQTFERPGGKHRHGICSVPNISGCWTAAPKIRIEVSVGDDPELTRWTYDLFCSLLPRMRQHKISFDRVGEIGTLRERLEAELAATKTFGATIGLVGAWSRKPSSE